MNLTFFDSKRNTLYIRTAVLLPDLSGMSTRDAWKTMQETFKLPMQERIDKYTTEMEHKHIMRELEKHPGCNISEFISK